MSPAISILLVDDHALLRETLRERLQKEPGMTVVGCAGNGNEAVELANRHKPDIIIMDIDMPGQVCFEAARTIRTLSEHTRVVYLSSFFHDRYIEDALGAHASGYITKDEPPDVVIKAIRLAASGVAYFSPKVQGRIVVEADGLSLSCSSRSRSSLLTPREIEVLRYIARGMSKKEVARSMHRAVKTVEHHSTSLMSKLDIHDRVELARFAIREGLAEA